MGDEAHEISRRTALKIFGGTGLAAGFGPKVLRLGRIGAVDERTVSQRLATLRAALGDVPRHEGTTLAPSLQVYAYRREDLLNVRFDLYNLELDVSGTTPMLVPVDSGTPAWLVAVLPFQSIAEYADAVGAKPPNSWPQTPVESLASGPSQLAFSVPASGIPYTLASLTDWQALTALLPAVASAGGTVAATDPTGAPTTTSPPLTYIEMAWQLLVAPDPSAFWDSPAAPVNNGTWTELWQARLTPSNPVIPTEIYAVWTPGFSSTGSPLEVMVDPFNTSLTDRAGENTYRTGLVALSSRASINESNPQNGTPAAAKTFMVTPLGVTADVQGGPYSDIAASNIVSWTHKMSVGRDTYVRIVLDGYLYPFGNRACLIQTTDREFHVSPSGDAVAYLVERTTVQVTQPTVSYPYPESGAAVDPDDGRQNPFVSIEVKTLTTPPIDPTSSTTDSPSVVLGSPHVSADDAIWINVGGSPFPFAFVGTDAEGRTVDFSAWAIWVSQYAFSSGSETWLNDVVKNYTDSANLEWRSPSLGGQLMAFAPPSTQPGATALHVDSLVLDSTDWITNSSETSPPWYPTLSQKYGAMIRLPAVAALTATDGDDPASGSQVVYESTMYLPDGFPYPAGVPEVFLTFADATPLNFTQPGSQSSQTGTSQSGGIAAPSFNIDGFARDLGPVSDSATLLTGAFDAKTFFAGLDAKILGAVPLTDIIKAVTAGPRLPEDSADAGSQAPTIHSVPIYKSGQTSPVALKTTIDWTPTITSGTTVLPGVFTPDNSDGSGLTIHAQLYAPLDPPGPPTSNIDGQLSNFTLTLFGSAAGVIEIHFTNVQFSQRTGSKSNVQVNIDTVTFIGALSFIQDFEELFASLGGPQIDVEPSGITAGYTVSLPSIGIGVFALENISLGGTLNIPFTGQPVRLTVNFCTRENPFLLSIYFFTGGGWFAISLGADGIELVEVGLEFGASISLDLGVASGGVTVAVGIYFALGSKTVMLTGFFQASGNLEVLGIISISIVFYLGLTYQSPPASAYGTASVSVTVSVLCFSASVTLTVTKQIYSSDPTISFAQAISATDWSNYCASFA
jgi:hypothetical protein